MGNYLEVFKFFAHNGIDFSILAAEPAINSKNTELNLSPTDFGDLLANFLDYYLQNQKYAKIGTLDSLCQSVSSGMAGICIFGECLGDYFAIAPDGEIYPCQRFVGYPAFSRGNVKDQPTLDDIKNLLWVNVQERQETVKEECGDCAYFDFCRGGMPIRTTFIEALKNPDSTVRIRAEISLGKIGGIAVEPLLHTLNFNENSLF